MNTFDHNAVIGAHPDLRNLYFINGYSGHGMQHTAGAGLALAEWMLQGKPKTIAVDELGFERLLHKWPLRELQVIG
jgi:glycine/D-amino acid oxidase-like deaminating enzyme